MNLSISSNDIAILHTETTPRCSGYIIFEDATCQRVILVKTHKGNYSFPKGKREKGEEIQKTALREVEEETGLTHDQYTKISDIALDEYTSKGIPSVRYYIAILNTSVSPIFTWDKEELAEAAWQDVSKISIPGIKIKLVRVKALQLAQKIGSNKWNAKEYLDNC